MTVLTVYPEKHPQQGERVSQFEDIQTRLDSLGILLERWEASRELSADADQQSVLHAYHASIHKLKKLYGFQSADVVSLKPDFAEKVALRQKFLSEHTHAEFEVRFFVEGQGLFYLHVNGKVYALLCTRGDLISVPANVPHWFDMGENPDFKCIRLFTSPDGWVADYTGSDIAKSFPTFEQFIEKYA